MQYAFFLKSGRPLTPPHHTTPYHTTPYHTTLHHTTLHTTTPHYTTPHYTTLHYTILHHTTLHYTTLHYTTPYYTTLHYTTLHYPTLPYPTLHHTADSPITQFWCLSDIFPLLGLPVRLLVLMTLEPQGVVVICKWAPTLKRCSNQNSQGMLLVGVCIRKREPFPVKGELNPKNDVFLSTVNLKGMENRFSNVFFACCDKWV